MTEQQFQTVFATNIRQSMQPEQVQIVFQLIRDEFEKQSQSGEQEFSMSQEIAAYITSICN